ncbi:MAG: hypothetical protein Q7S40_09305 [Opitutaceae bacterium]|nr:hypothetical protein [Opitutaceae bacterium]
MLLLGWTLATGAHWDVLQVAAWARMWFSYSRVQPLAAALETTFSPDAMCGACRTIQAARHDQAGDVTVDLHATEKPLLLLPSVRAIAAESPNRIAFARPDNSPQPPSWRAAPPVPPPRFAVTTAA